jgi:site-specific DNA recombinase
MRRCGVNIEYVLGEYPDTPEGNLNKNLKAVIAEYERVKIAERMTRGKRLKVQAGHVLLHGHRPYGYHVAEQNGRKTLIIHEPEAEVVRLVYKWYTQGDGDSAPMSIKGITTKLTSLKIPTYSDLEASSPTKKRRPVGAWAQSSVRNMLSLETYAGVWHYGKRNFVDDHWVNHPEETWIRIEVPAIVTREVWQAAQDRRSENTKPGRASRHQCLLRKRLICTECKCRIQTDERRSSKQPEHTLYIYYVCKARKLYATDCSQRLSYRADVVDALTWDWVRSIVSDPERLHANLDDYQRQQKQAAQNKLDRLEIIADLIHQESSKLQRLVDLYVDGNIDKETWFERKQRLEQTIAGLRLEQSFVQAEVDVEVISDDAVAALQAFADEIVDVMAAAEESFELRRAIVERLKITGSIAVEDGVKVLRLVCFLGEGTFRLDPTSTASTATAAVCATASRISTVRCWSRPMRWNCYAASWRVNESRATSAPGL